MTPRSAFFSHIEPLEARIAPALALQHPLADLVAGSGKTGAVVDLSKMFDAAATHANRTVVQFTTNFDTDANTAGIQPGVILIELLDDLTPLTVQNFLAYVNHRNAHGDFDGTFFHRLVSNFVLQGGGFESGGTHEHIQVGPEVHNEFDASRSNLRGTITMAKTGIGPNTATSEFFFNLKDNNTGAAAVGNLDLQNGGFTVFGTVIQGLSAIDSIAALPTAPASGFQAPAQNYNPDPDNNPNTLGPVPTVDQLIRVTEAKVIPPTPGDAAGITFSVEHIYKAGTTTDSDLVSAKITGTTLNLKYKPGASGDVDVVVKAVGRGDMATDTFHVTVRPNLIANIVDDGLPIAPAAGESAAVKIKLTNSGAAVAKGKVDIRFFLAEEVAGSTASPPPLVTPLVKIPLGELLGRSISIPGGGAATLVGKVQVPADLVADIGKTYRLIAEVAPTGDVAAQQLFSDDDDALDGGRHQLLNQFGAFGSRSKVPLSYVESDGDRVTFTITGGGFGQLTPDGAGKVDLAVFSTNALSKLSAKVTKGAGGDGRIALNDIGLTSVLNSAALGLADVDGFVAASGGLRTLQLGSLTGPGTLAIGAFLPANTTKAAITLGRVHDYSFESSMPIGSFTAIEWLDTAGPGETLNFLTLDKFAVTGAKRGPRGDLQASVNISGATGTGAFTIAGLLKNSTVTTAGDIGTMTLGGIDHSRVFSGTSARPAVLGDFFAERSIAKFIIEGIAGFAGDLFTDSQIAAQNIGAITVQKVGTSGAAGAFGFVADAIKSYNRIGGPKLKGLDAPLALTPAGQADKAGDYLVTIL